MKETLSRWVTKLSDYTGCNRKVAVVLFVIVVVGCCLVGYTVLSLYKNYRAANETSVGTEFKDIVAKDKDGNILKLSDVVKSNKLTLIDFWASWCGPCRAEMPNVKKVYADYHDKGFEVYGVSLDEDKDAWLNAVRDLELPWIQVNDVVDSDASGSSAYGIRFIPSTILIDQNGAIIGKNLRGEDLAKKVAEILK